MITERVWMSKSTRNLTENITSKVRKQTKELNFKLVKNLDETCDSKMWIYDWLTERRGLNLFHVL